MHIQNISQSTFFPRCHQTAGWYTGGIQLRWGGWAIVLVSVAGRSVTHQQQPWWEAALAVEPVQSLHLRRPRYSALEPIAQALGCPRVSEAGWRLQAVSFCHPDCVSAVDIALCSTWIWDTKMLTLCVHSHWVMHASSLALLSAAFQYFQVPIQSAKTFTIAHETMCILILGHFSVDKKQITSSTGQNAAH